MKDDTSFSYADFRRMFSEVGIAESSVRKSYVGLDRLRKRKNLSWHHVQDLVHTLGSSLTVEMLKNEGKTLKIARIPLTDRDWEQMITAPCGWAITTSLETLDHFASDSAGIR